MPITKTWLLDGPRSALLHVYMENTGADPEFDNYVLVDPTADFQTPMAAKAGLTVEQVWYSTAWFDSKLSFDAIEDANVWVFPRDGELHHDFRYFGGLADRSWPDANGRLLLTTAGFATPGVVGTMVIELKKSK